MRIVLHIGYNKTGSSSIQANLNENRKAYLSKGVLYPKTGVFDDAHYGVSRHILGRPDYNKDRGGDVAGKLVSEVESSCCDVVIISSEYFCTANFNEVKQVKEFFDNSFPGVDVNIVVYLRRHDLWFESLFNQFEKTAVSPSCRMDIGSFFIHSLGAKSPDASYLRVLNLWARTFGDESMKVRPFEPKYFVGNGIVGDLLDLIGCADLVVKEEEVIKNRSLGPDFLYTIGTIKRLLPEEYAQEVVTQIQRKSLYRKGVAPDGFGKFSDSERLSIYRFFAPEYHAIARRFLGREDGRLFRDVPGMH